MLEKKKQMLLDLDFYFFSSNDFFYEYSIWDAIVDHI